MNELPLSIQKAIRKYDPVTADGLTYYPVLVKEYDEFLIGQPALEVLHQSLPVRFMRMPLLAALYQMDYEAALNGEQMTGLFSRALIGLALSLRLGEGLGIEERAKMFSVISDHRRPERLMSLRFSIGVGEEKEITPAQYQRARIIIAAQNGVRIESEKADPDLVQAEKDLSEMNGISLNANIDDLISGVAAMSGVDERDMDEWPILKLIKRQKSYTRILDYLVCGFGQVNGTTWKGGNPSPHPFFSRTEKGGFGAHVALGDFAGGAGTRAVANAGQQTT